MSEPPPWSQLLAERLLIDLDEVIEAEVQRRTDGLRRALLNSVSHELRTPLASMVALAGSLRQSDVEWSEGEQAEFAQAIENEALRLNRLVDNLLDLARLEDGTLRPEKSWYDVGALIDDVISRLRGMGVSHRVQILVAEDLPPVPLDYVQIERALTNLLEHAIGRAPEGTAVAIGARVDDGCLRVDVSDAGTTVDAAALPRLFEPFARPKELGVGLAVARGLVEAHGGRIWAVCDSGLQVSLALPL